MSFLKLFTPTSLATSQFIGGRRSTTIGSTILVIGVVCSGKLSPVINLLSSSFSSSSGGSLNKSTSSFLQQHQHSSFLGLIKTGMASAASTSPTLPEDVKAKLDQIADVKIDETGRFKYILIKVFAENKEGKHIDSNSKLVVRGRADCPYHGDIFDKFQEETSRLQGFDDEILGGGRIERSGNKIFVFGYSQGYGKADHNLTVEILKKRYPTHDITWSDEGY